MIENFLPSATIASRQLPGSSGFSPAPPSHVGSPSTSDYAGSEVREQFDQFVGEVFFGQMLSAMRKTVGKPAYFHGGRAEEVFQGQLDQTIAQDLAKTTGKQFTDSMFALSALTRR